jgi:DegV family protein with EDD domain
MEKVAVVTDSCASIPPDLIQSLDIHLIPYYIHRGQEVLRDLVTIDAETFYSWLPTARELPTTASPGPGDYETKYRELAAKGITEIISIHMTSKGSGAFQAAQAAKKMVLESLPTLKIEIIDTLNVAMCHGWIAIEAARAAINNVRLDGIVRRVREMIPVTHMIQTADTLKYLQMGGRIGRATHLVGSILNIKPLIGMQEGVIVALGKARSRSRAYQSMVDFVENKVGDQAIKLAYVHAAAMSEVYKLKDLIESRIKVAESLIAELSPALGVHSGPGTTGLCFFPVRNS